MHYINEQITKTFEHLLNLRHSIDRFLSSSKTSRIFYRINYEKLEKYRHENQTRIIHRNNISTQTNELNYPIDFIHSSTKTLSTISKGINESDISIDLSSSLTHTTNDSNISSSELSVSPYNFNSLYIRHMFGDDSFED